jgi:hypothetical protein
MRIKKWDIAEYAIGEYKSSGVVLDVFDDGHILTDTDGNVEARYIESFRAGGRKRLYESEKYKDKPYREWLSKNYGLEIPEEYEDGDK